MNNSSPPFGMDIYVQRRKRLCSKVASGQMLFIGNNHSPRNFKDNYYEFRQDSTFLYYFGINQPNLLGLIDAENGSATIFGNEIGLDAIIWTGPKQSIAEIAERVGISEVLPLSKIKAKLAGQLHYLPTYRSDHKQLLNELFDNQKIVPSPTLRQAVIAQRNIKSEEEIQQLQQAGTICGNMHRAVMKACRPGLHEYDLVSVASKFIWNNQVQWAYQPILTTNGEILHNHNYDQQLDEDKMVLYDGGVELSSGYCSDITRTFPCGDHFTSLQAEIYEIVLASYNEAVALARPDKSFKEIHLAASKVLVEGLIDIGWMKGNADEAVSVGAHTMFFQCGLGHMMGLDVHDMENLGEEHVGYEKPEDKSKAFGLKSLRLGRKLKTGHCITIEPGIYVIPALIDKFQSENKYSDFLNYEAIKNNRDFGGIRIEDNFVITEQGNLNLDGTLPTDIAGIEAMKATLMQHS